MRLLPLLLLAGCDSGPSIAIVPPEVPAFGYQTVEVDLAEADLSADEVYGARVAGIRALDLEVCGEACLAFTVQGSPEPGLVTVVLETASGDVSFEEAFSYAAPVDPLFDRTFALGASLSEGFRSGVPSAEGTLGAGPALVARQAGAFLGLPLLVPGLFVPIAPTDVGAPPNCAFTDYSDHNAAQITDVVAAMTDEEDGFDYALGRQDAEIEVRNVAVGGATVRDLLVNPDFTDPGELILGHLVHEPSGGLLDPLGPTQVDLAEAAAPTVIFLLDGVGNDVLDPILAEGTIDPSLVTPIDQLRPDLETLIARLAATGAEVFVGNIPSPCLLPLAEDKRRAMAAAGASAEEVAAACAAVGAATDDAAALLDEVVSAYANVHVVDYKSEVEGIAAEGLDVGEETLSLGRFGGLVGMDGLHFTATGYAVMATLTLDAVEAETGVVVAPPDIAAVLASDPESPQALQAAGLDLAACGATR